MRRQILSVSLLALIITLAAWGAKGHRAVATIAEKHLNPITLKVIATYLKGESMADGSTWADEIRNQPLYKKTSSWHFLNLPLGLSHDQFVQTVKSQRDDNIYTALLKAEANLQDPALGFDQKQESLKFLIHLVGDAHQPMHISRKEDKGGNTIQVRFEGKGTNLHALWDSRLIDHERLNDTEMAAKYDWANAAQIAKWQKDAPIEWLWESYQISTELYDDVKPGDNIDEAYYQRYIPIIHLRIDQAGIRLAGELNRICTELPVVPKDLSSVLQNKVTQGIISRVNLDRAKDVVGQAISTDGKVYGIKDIGSMVLVNLGAAYPHQMLTVVLKGEAKPLAVQLTGKTIAVTGTVIEFKGKPEIVVTQSNQIAILK